MFGIAVSFANATLMGQRLNKLNRLHILESFRVLQLLSTRLELVRILTQAWKPSSVYLVLDFVDLLALIPSLATELLLCIFNHVIAMVLKYGLVPTNSMRTSTNSIWRSWERFKDFLTGRPWAAGVLALLGVLTNTARIHQAKLSFLVSAIKDNASYTYAVIQWQIIDGKSNSWTSRYIRLAAWSLL